MNTKHTHVNPSGPRYLPLRIDQHTYGTTHRVKQLLLLTLLSFTCLQQATAMDNKSNVDKHQRVLQANLFWALEFAPERVSHFLKDVVRNATSKRGHSPLFAATMIYIAFASDSRIPSRDSCRDSCLRAIKIIKTFRDSCLRAIKNIKTLTEAGFTYNNRDKAYFYLASEFTYDSPFSYNKTPQFIEKLLEKIIVQTGLSGMNDFLDIPEREIHEGEINFWNIALSMAICKTRDPEAVKMLLEHGSYPYYKGHLEKAYELRYNCDVIYKKRLKDIIQLLEDAADHRSNDDLLSKERQD